MHWTSDSLTPEHPGEAETWKQGRGSAGLGPHGPHQEALRAAPLPDFSSRFEI